jgi:membrane-associated phospholipid phosphatase
MLKAPNRCYGVPNSRIGADLLVPRLIFAAAVATLGARQAHAQSPTNLNVLQGLAPISALETTIIGKAALAANLSVTAAIQDGSANQPLLLSFTEQRQQALRDAYITDGNAYELADGLGTKLGGIYWSLTTIQSTDDGKTSSFTSLSPAVALLIAYTNATTRSDSDTAKYFFGNATADSDAPVSAEALAILAGVKGYTDIFGRAYGRLAGSAGADAYGNSRPFQTEPHLTSFAGKDFFGAQSKNLDFLRGPSQDLMSSPSFPSGHTTYGYAESLLLALLVPQRYLEMITRAAEYGNNRIILGAHYAMDVLGGRTLAIYDIAQLLANKPRYIGIRRGDVSIEDYQLAFAAAGSDVTAAMEKACGDKVAVCARRDQSRFADAAKNKSFYETTQTYGLPVVFEQHADSKEDVAQLASEAGYLLTFAYPYLTLAEADAILTETEGPGGGFLDNGSAFGVYSRLNLYKAAERAMALRH